MTIRNPNVGDMFVSFITGELWYLERELDHDPWTGKPGQYFEFTDPYGLNPPWYLTLEGCLDVQKTKILKFAWTKEEAKHWK